VVDWHREMAWLLHELDRNDPLVTTSTSAFAMTFSAAIPEYPLVYEPVWQLPEIDFVQLHSLGLVFPVADTIFLLVDRRAQYGKPVLLVEAGVDIQGLEENRALSRAPSAPA
jgi:hypothetical protein